MNFRAVWISDVHLGTRDSQATKLNDFLGHLHTDKLYLVGDIVDVWALRRDPYWPQEHEEALLRFYRLGCEGTEVFWIPGNHDEVLRVQAFLKLICYDLMIVPDEVHETKNGKKLWILHGDTFDPTMKNTTLTYFSDWLYSKVLFFNRQLNALRKRWGHDHWSFSHFIKVRFKTVVSLISDFKHRIAQEAAGQECDGVVCGHLHLPEILSFDGVTYYNDGDWVDNCTFLAEDETGAVNLYRYLGEGQYELLQTSDGAPRAT